MLCPGVGVVRSALYMAVRIIFTPAVAPSCLVWLNPVGGYVFCFFGVFHSNTINKLIKSLVTGLGKVQLHQ